MTYINGRIFRGAALFAAVMLTCNSAARADDFEKFQERARAQVKKTISNLAKERGPSIVTLRFIAKESMMG